MNRDQPRVLFSYFSRCCMLVVPSTKWQLLFVTTRRGTTGDVVQRHLFRYYSMHIAGNAGESAKSIGYAPFLRRRCSSLQATRFYFYRAFPRFAVRWALFLFSDTAAFSDIEILARPDQPTSPVAERSFVLWLPSATCGTVQFFVRLFSYGKKKAA